MRTAIITIAMLLFISSNALSQTNQCAGTDPTGVVSAPKIGYAVLNDHLTVAPDKQPVTASYNLTVLDGANVVTSVALAKTSFTAITGTPANCYSFVFPAIPSLTTNKQYNLRLEAVGPGGSSSRLFTQSFFLPGAPSEPLSLRLAVLDMLSRMSQKLYSMRLFGR